MDLPRPLARVILAACALLAACEVLPPPPEPPVLDVEVEHRRTAWPATGATYRALMGAMAEQAPIRSDGKRWPGNTAQAVNVRWTTTSSRRWCALATVDVSLELTISMPLAVHEAELDAAAAKRWRHYHDVLEAHEVEHAVIAERVVRRYADMFANIEPAGDCVRLERRLKNVHEAMFAELAREGDGYDAVTDHGRRQEAWR